MIKHYFKIAMRNLAKQKGLSFINIIGLSIGLACFSVFLLYAVNEFSFDRFHKNADNIYRVYRWTESLNGREAVGDVHLPSPLGPAMKSDLTGVQEYVRIRDAWDESVIKIDGDTRKARVSFADPSFFSVFSFPLRLGTPAALREMQSLVITRSKARELFGEENVLGRTMEVRVDDEFIPFTITGVAEDIPANSSIRFDLLGNFNFMETIGFAKRRVNNWRISSYITYVQLREGSGLPGDRKALAAFRNKYYPNETEDLKKSGYSWKGQDNPIRYALQPVKAQHTDTKVWGGAVENVNPKTIWILLSIAGAVLLIACMNFTTLAIGRSAGRAKEIGVRKVIGGERMQLVLQFLAEAVILSFISALVGLVLASLLLPYFNSLSGRELSFSFAHYPEIGWMLFGLTVIVGLLAGTYPALVLSGFRPVEVLKRKIRVSGSNFFTKSLVTAQFAVSIGLIICTIIILEQTAYMSRQNPGFNRENIVMVQSDHRKAKEIFPLFRQAIESRSDIDAVAGAELALGEEAGWSRSGFEYNGVPRNVYEYFVDPDYVPMMGMQIIAGRNFDRRIASDTTTSVIVNESMMREFGWTIDNAVGQRLSGYAENKTPEVIGVVKNFHFRPLREEVQPQMFHQFADYMPAQIFVKIKPGNPSPALAAMEKAWTAIMPEIPFTYTFLDESLDKFYKAERRWSGIIGWAGGISVFLACLGLFGLARLAAVNRTKEIGIRKVMGASIPVIVRLLSVNFLKLVGIALLIAAPLSWLIMDRWLQDFAYRISIGWWAFLAAGFGAVAIAFITISFQAVKAGMGKPVKSLRTE